MTRFPQVKEIRGTYDICDIYAKKQTDTRESMEDF